MSRNNNLIMSKIIHDNKSPIFNFGEGIKACYISHFITLELQSQLIEYLDQFPYCQITYNKYGKIRQTPRLTYCYGQYNGESTAKYRGKEFQTEAIPEWLLQLKEPIEKYIGCDFNAVIMNKYINGENNISWHQDDESFLEHKIIASISLGQERAFQFKLTEHSQVHEITPISGSLLIFDSLWHTLPKRAHIDQTRYNITFRKVKDSRGIGNYYYYNRN